jgi:transcriptional regulator with XRE-family HTH domain
MTTNQSIKIIGNNIKRARIKMGLRIIDLSEKSGLSFESLQKIESGKDFKVSSWIKLTRVLGDLSIDKNEDEKLETLSPIEMSDAISTNEIKRVRVKK